MCTCHSAPRLTLRGGNGGCGQQPLCTLYVGLGLLGFLGLVLIGRLLMAGCLMDVGGYQSTYVGSGQLNHVYSLDWDD